MWRIRRNQLEQSIHRKLVQVRSKELVLVCSMLELVRSKLELARSMAQAEGNRT